MYYMFLIININYFLLTRSGNSLKVFECILNNLLSFNVNVCN